jgi:hypothetical protein
MFMKNQQNNPGNKKGTQGQQNKEENPQGQSGSGSKMQGESGQQQGSQREKEQRSGQQGEKQGEKQKENKEGRSQSGDVTSRTSSDVKNTDRGRLPGETTGQEEDLSQSDTENLQDEDDVKGR